MERVADVVQLLEQWFPPSLAEPWDNVGLLLGDPNRPVRRLMTCLSVTASVVGEAEQKEVDLLVSHHPIFYRETRRLVATEYAQELVLRLAAQRIAVYSPHTAFDNAARGINERWASALALQQIRALRPRAGEPQAKVVVFVPRDALERVLNALFEAGAGTIGHYHECSFRVAGTGTFFGTEMTQPAVGQKGRREEVEEFRVEVLCPMNRLREAIAAMRREHPYEEPAFDVYPLWSAPDERTGRGRMGHLKRPLTLVELARQVASVVGSSAVGVVGPKDRVLRQVGISCGAGDELLEDAARRGCDAFLTGELRLHRIQQALDLGITLILAGHFETERFGVVALAEELAAAFPNLEVWASTAERPPVEYFTVA
jgi:dinuclear metal center YbgI/SA1388 family protein